MDTYFCYRNLNRKGVVYSMRNPKTGIVEKYSDLVFLKNVEFKVSKSGSARVKKQGRRNVHAGVQGIEISNKEIKNYLGFRKAHYDPYTCDSFIDVATNKKIEVADFVILDNCGIRYLKDTK